MRTASIYQLNVKIKYLLVSDFEKLLRLLTDTFSSVGVISW